MSVPRLLRLVVRLTALVLALALAGLIALIVPSADNGPFMTPFAALLIGLTSTLVLLGYVSGLPDPTAEGTSVPPERDQPEAPPG